MSKLSREKLVDLTEIINLEAIQQLPKGTEHFVSDPHGEYEAFEHILRNGSGSIREKVKTLFQGELSEEDQTELCFVIYYPEDLLADVDFSVDDWLKLMECLVKVARFTSSKYTRSKVRKALPKEFAYILEELLYQYDADYNKEGYYSAIFEKIVQLDLAEYFCACLAKLIQRFVVDHLHVLGDIYDRGPSPDKIIDRLMKLPSLDIQLGNHDILWIGAFSGSLACLTNTLRIAARYGNLELLEKNYGIDLSHAKAFSRKNYQINPAFAPRVDKHQFSAQDIEDAMYLQQAFAIMQFKVEGAVIQRRPEFDLQGRMFLDKLSEEGTSLDYYGRQMDIVNGCFQLVKPEQPFALTEEEHDILTDLLQQFQSSLKLKKHLQFLVEKGTLYQKYNGNLLFHGCVPCKADGEFLEAQLGIWRYSGVQLMDFFESCIHKAFAEPEITDDLATDVIWYLWCGEGSSLFGKKAMKTFERYFLEDKATHQEEKNAYYRLRNEEDFCERILEEFDLPKDGHIINGHTPVKVYKGETPIKANGKLLVIDGGLSKPYQRVTGIAGYTLLYNSFGISLIAHQPFTSKQEAIRNRQDILSQRTIVVRQSCRQYVQDTDIGKRLEKESKELMNKYTKKPRNL